MQIWNPKTVKLFAILGAIFVTNALLAELIGVKIFALEGSLGISPFNWNLFGQEGSLNFTVGVLIWPVVFILTDVVNEYFGPKGVRFLSWLAVGLICYAFILIFIAIHLTPAEWWPASMQEKGVPNLQTAFEVIFGQGMWIIIGSITAFLIGQLVDALVFHKIKRLTGDKHLWLRATGSTLVSQILDSFVVLYIAFVVGPAKWSIALFLAIGTVNYIYKFAAAIVLTPLIYLAHRVIDALIGKELSAELRSRAHNETNFKDLLSN